MRIWHLAALLPLTLLCLAPDCGELPGDGSGSADTGDSGAADEERLRLATADCQKRGKCIVANGGAFSQTECETANRVDGERADSRSCGDSYDTFMACAAAVVYDCTQPTDAQLTVACNNLFVAYNSCMSQTR